MSAIAKLYDVILCNRFLQWYKPKFEQAGAQKGRGCEEQIFVIRLLIDIARKCKFPLYIGYVDYMKAYDKVRRNVLLDMLYRAGCGTIFLMAIAASLVNCSGLYILEVKYLKHQLEYDRVHPQVVRYLRSLLTQQ